MKRKGEGEKEREKETCPNDSSNGFEGLVLVQELFDLADQPKQEDIHNENAWVRSEWQ